MDSTLRFVFLGLAFLATLLAATSLEARALEIARGEAAPVDGVAVTVTEVPAA